MQLSLVVLLATIAAWAISHPICLDSTPPIGASQGVTFCSGRQVPWKRSDGRCCTDDQEDAIRQVFNDTIATYNMSSGPCLGMLKNVLCNQCNPFAGHLFGNESANDPIFCADFADGFIDVCGEALANETHVAPAPPDTFYCAPFSPQTYFNASGLEGQAALVPAFPNLEGKLPPALTGAYLLPGGGTWWVIAQTGLIVAFEDSPQAENITVVFNITDRVVTDEEGLLGLVFSPYFVLPSTTLNASDAFNGTSETAGATAGGNETVAANSTDVNVTTDSFFYVNYIAYDDAGTRVTRVSRFDLAAVAGMQDWSNGTSAYDNATSLQVINASWHGAWYGGWNDTWEPEFNTSQLADTQEIILEFEQPFSNHNGGWLGFGREDGYLYISTGDGGSQGDPNNNAQNTSRVLGKMLRIDVGANASSSGYLIPEDNPFGNEVWAYGLRNPWRCSFDPFNASLIWCGDVGQNSLEEVNLLEKGGNYGWHAYDGILPYPPANYSPLPANVTPPIYNYCHNAGYAASDLCNGNFVGNSITGGFVYRGERYRDVLAGAYIFSDFESLLLGAVQFNETSGRYEGRPLVASGVAASAFAEGQDGELYVVMHSYTESGMLYHFKCGSECGESGRVPESNSTRRRLDLSSSDAGILVAAAVMAGGALW